MHSSLFDDTSRRIFRFGSAFGFLLLYLLIGSIIAMLTVGSEFTLASVLVLFAWPVVAVFWLLYLLAALACMAFAFLLLMWASYSWNRYNVG